MLLYIVFGALQVIYLLHITAYYYYWKKSIARSHAPQDISGATFITVLLVARNEEDSIQACLNSILQQSYSSDYFEVLFIDDFSEDSTLDIVLANFQNRVKVISLKEVLEPTFEKSANKKRAIEIGIQQAKGSIIACTDADVVVPVNWLSTIECYFQNKDVQYITGAVIYNDGHKFVEQFQSVDMLSMIGITSASIQMGNPYMSNGANMAYRKDAFLACGGYKGIDSLASGDDVLLMNKIHKHFGSKSIQFVQQHSFAVSTKSENNWLDFYHQRTRWVSKSTAYSSLRVKFTLLFMYLYHLSYVAVLVSLFFTSTALTCFLLAWVLKSIIDFLFIQQISTYYNKKYNVLLIPIYELVYIIYVSIIGLSSMMGYYQWKNRSIKK